MAQYVQVLSQSDKPTPDELRHYYPNIVENQQTIQYVLKPDEQQFPTQQILVSSTDRLMVVDGQSQQVIIDQSQVPYRSQQYVFQDAKVEFQEGQNQQPVYYMDESGSHRPEQVQTEQQAVPQPIVLNHQLPGTPPVKLQQSSSKNVTPTLGQHQMSELQLQPIRQERQIVQQNSRSVRPPVQLIPQRPPHAVQQKTANQAVQPAPRVGGQVQGRRIEVPNLQRSIQHEEIQENDSQEAIALDDGSIVTVAQYKLLLAEKKKSLASVMPAIQERLEAPPIVASQSAAQRRKYNRNSNPRPARGGRGGVRPGRGNLNNVHYGMTSESSNQSPPPPRFPLQQPTTPARRISAPRRGSIIPPSPGNIIAPPSHGMPSRFIPQSPQPPMVMQSQRHVSQPVQAQPAVPVQQTAPLQQPQYIIQPHGHPQQQQQQQRQQQSPLPAFVPSSQIQHIIENTPVSDDYLDSIRMLVLLSNGEQRLITFTLPKEQCSIQEILEQVGVPLQPDTKIECTETNTNGINYIVTVGLSQYVQPDRSPEVKREPEESETAPIPKPVIPDVPPKPPTPEPPKEVPKLIPGRLAVCMHCGYLSEDFNKCLRCKRKLPEDVRSVAGADQPVLKKPETIGMKPALIPDKKLSPINKTIVNNSGPAKASSSTSRTRKKEKSKTLEAEPVILTLSSDEEEDSSSKSTIIAPLKLVEAHLALADVKKEPSINDIQQSDHELFAQGVKGGGREENLPNMETFIFCRTVRIGSYRFVPPDDLIVGSAGVTIKVPMPKERNEIKTITIERKHIVKVLVTFQKMLPVIFYYVMPSVGQSIRDQLGMVEGSEPYFDPLSKEEAYKRITVLPEILADETQIVFKHVYGKPCNIMDELTAKEANNILLKTCPKEVTKAISVSTGLGEIKQLLIYPPGKGGLSINTEDYMCLGQDQFLNDVIIDFYLKYVVQNLPKELQERVHVFSTFFYKRLTTKPLKASRRSHPSEVDSSLTPAQKRHARVKNWTKTVNLFEKDFIIIPINENCHWFLAIICFPGLDGPYSFEGKPVKLEPATRRKKAVATIGNVTITQVKAEKEEAINCEDGEASDKDEAEGDDSELDSEEEIEEPPKPEIQPIKQPCVLIFDSLAGASRSRVVATLRDYLTCEYKIKMSSERIFNKDLIRCACPKVPQQTNFTDCGLYLLQYVESFFQNPIKDYRIPISELRNWFEELTVTKKREDIAKLIKELMVQYDKDLCVLPDIILPTLNGRLLPPVEDDMDEEEEDEEIEEDEDEMLEDELEAEAMNEAMLESGEFEDQELESSEIESELHRSSETGETEYPDVETETPLQSPIKPSSQCHDDNFEQTVTVIRPDVSEVKKQSSRDTLSYLKAKRIVRHKASDSPDPKKLKLSTTF